MKLIIPVAGRSSRFPGVRPKWLLTHPRGTFMLTEALRGLSHHIFSDLYIVALQEHRAQWDFEALLTKEVTELFPHVSVHFVFLHAPTASQVETVARCLDFIGGDFSFAVKDSDNHFTLDVIPENSVAYVDLNDLSVSNTRAKSYVEISEEGLLLNIVEKSIISPYFSCGLYSFGSSKNFLTTSSDLLHLDNLYISDIITRQVYAGEVFSCVKGSNYLDWGTLEDWQTFRRKYKTIFVDLDGTIVSSDFRSFGMDWGENKLLEGNCAFLRSLHATGTVQLIITTARPDSSRAATIKFLNDNEIPFDKIIFGLFHAKRILINDFSNSNPYPTATAINLPRDSDNLALYGFF